MAPLINRWEHWRMQALHNEINTLRYCFTHRSWSCKHTKGNQVRRRRQQVFLETPYYTLSTKLNNAAQPIDMEPDNATR
jgi:hypothetical protein